MQKGIWKRNLFHGGLQVEHPEKPSQEVIDRLKVAGFRWSPRQRIWYAKETQARIDLLESLAEYAGEIGERLSFAEHMQAKVDRSKERAGRYEDLAEKNRTVGRELLDEAHKMAEIIPFGQPIQVGHHSEKSDRNYRARIHNKMGKGFKALETAEYYDHRAAASDGYEERTFDSGKIQRNIKKLEARVRSMILYSDKHIFRWQVELRRYHAGISKERGGDLLSRETLQWCEDRILVLEEQLDYWRSIIRQKQAVDGLKVWGPGDFEKGERIEANGAEAIIIRVNKKSLTVEYGGTKAWMNMLNVTKVRYDSLSQTCKQAE